MIVVMRAGATPAQIEEVNERLRQLGFALNISRGVERTIIGVIGDRKEEAAAAMEALEQVEKVVPILAPYKQAARAFRATDTTVAVRGARFGPGVFQVIAGPCAVESYEQVKETALAVKAAGGRVLRAGAYKPRTSPYSFQGLEEQGLEILRAVGDETGLLITTEVKDTGKLDLVARYADILQIGARNMQNFSLLKEAGHLRKPVVLKRGMAATYEEWLMAAEYVLKGGNADVILCERGIRTFESYTRNTLDLAAVPAMKDLTHLPVIVDPSHATGRWKMVRPMAMAALASGADGLMVEVHPRPAEALSDGPQQLNLDNYAAMVEDLGRVAEAMGKSL